MKSYVFVVFVVYLNYKQCMECQYLRREKLNIYFLLILCKFEVAAPALGDCAFEDDECGWSNPEKREGVDELDWERSAATEGAR